MGIQNSPRTTENSSLAMVSEFGWLELAEETPTSPGRAQPRVIDTGEQLAQLVAAEDPSAALVSGWPGFCNSEKQPTNASDNTWSTLQVKDTGEQLAQLVAAEDPSLALVSDHGWLNTAANTINSTRDPSLASQSGGQDTAEITNNLIEGPSLTTHHAHSNETVTFTLPVVTSEEAGSSLETNNRSLGTNYISLGINNSSLGTNNRFLGTNNSLTATNNSRSYQGLQVTNYPGEPITEAAKTRPSVIVSRSSRKRAFKETNGSEEKKPLVEKNAPAPILMPDSIMDDDQDEVPPAVLEKRRKANARCKKYRVNKKQKEEIEETELEMLTSRNKFLREEEKRLTDRKRKLQQSYLSLIRQKKIRFE